MLNYELYKVFYFVAKYLSFSKAASKLYISQSAVSQNIKSLEKELNTELFIRSTKNVSLSKSGSLLLEHVEPAFNLIKSGEKSIREINALQRGELHIGANDTISKDFLLPHLNKFHKLYPNIHLLITNRTSSTCIELLKQNTVDLIISNLPNDKVTSSMKVKEIYSFNDIFIGGKEYNELNKKTINLKKLSSYPLLMLEEKTTTRKFLEKYLNKYGIEIEAKIELGSVDLLIEMAKIGLGIAYVPDYSLDLKKEGLFKLDIKEKIAKRKLAVIRNKNIPLTNAAEKFIELF
ncbi:LysR family transcriptional regulator [Halanaerobium sp. MA284_MarDTE_T2]|uniref:LysR family transcriptional regulator n=1 Tax=Halanaerobium sp. MA284_MarDTE_T2 TaxID=2183913 RepID=UPI000DF1E26F|nr:LysR family transcriptional regulator [Halanaerobium sp. MA284_MarDTE_T2]RCW50775.1 DNA-binding transcriptional LysR family regulator [Halanaerobium sp. MA284_MarDTE_T2]